MTLDLLSKPKNRWLIGLVVAATTITGGIALYGISNFGSVGQSSAPTPITPTVTKIAALGRIEPEADVIHLSTPQALDGDRVAQVLVKEGDRVQAGQIVAILDSHDRLQAALFEAQEQVEIAKVRLIQVKAGAKSGEIAAQQAKIAQAQAELRGDVTTQQATITRSQSEVDNARAEYNRYQLLYGQGAISASVFDQKRLALSIAQAQLNEAQASQNRTAETLQAQINEARATLDQIAEVRPVEIQVAQTEVNQAIASVKRAQTELEQAYIQAPKAGQILKIHTQAGEKIQASDNGNETGLLDLGQTDQMIVVAEVYQTDIGKVRLGQQAVITSQVFPDELRGTVSQIGLQVARQNVFSNQPGENLDRRVVEVKIRLTPDASKQVAGLTNLQVQAAIQQ